MTGVEAQPLAAQARRVVQALEVVGTPLEPEQIRALEAALGASDAREVVAGVQRVLDPLCLVFVHVNPESRVKAAPGPAAPELAQGGWRVFLIKVHNEAGVTAPLRIHSPNAEPPYLPSSGEAEPTQGLDMAAVRDRWLTIESFDQRPLAPALSGLALEYRLLLLSARDAGPREAKLVFDVGQGTQDLGFRAEADLLFRCAPAVPVTLRVRDVDGRPTTARFVIRDGRGHVFPTPAQRLEPDFFFHDQVYRADGEQVLLTPGRYQVSWTRGPEYRVRTRTIVVPEGAAHAEAFQLERWIDLAALGWYSGDHHVHAAGCAHYEAPSQGVGPAAMMRHVLGEDLNVGCVLSWGPCWYSQKGFFDGATHPLSTPRHLLRYDVEVSGFPSSHAGHIVLLRLREDDYPGTTRIEDWPSWDLPILQWAHQQGAVVGFAHSGFGLEVDGAELPTMQVPRFDGIGANEYVVDVTHGAVDFISTVDTPAIWELNAWYHVLNAGYATRISGETDFPCIYGERVGLGRSYVRLGAEQPLSFDAWVEGIRSGSSYVSDGLSHIVGFEAGGLAVGAPGAGGRASVLAARRGEKLRVRARVAALLPEEPREDIRSRPLDEQPYWHLERARIGASRRVGVELVVNGRAVDRREIEADGTLVPVEFELEPGISSWVALRILPSSHSNPIFVELDGRPIRASKSSAHWCEQAVETCWNSKRGRIRESERAAARAAYDAAAAAYRARAAEAESD
ncbi:MAG: hypothetical protein EYC70_03655 [Planctomycetota bacterium]|nr:MAG: hypothetical protein EYC70_03655 [Planctomycetota bacterium]